MVGKGRPMQNEGPGKPDGDSKKSPKQKGRFNQECSFGGFVYSLLWRSDSKGIKLERKLFGNIVF